MNELLSWGLPIAAVLALVTLGFNTLQVVSSNDEFWIAKCWFVLAAIVALARFIFWGITTNRSLTTRLIVCFIACGLVAAAAIEAVRYVNRKSERWAKSSQVPATSLAQTTIDSPQLEEKPFYETPEYDLTPRAAQPLVIPIKERQATTPDERITVDVTPEYLVGFFSEHTAAQANKLAEAFIGKWMKVSGIVEDVQSYKDYSEVYFRRALIKPLVCARFHEQRWIDRVVALKLGDNLTVLGQIQNVNRLTVFMDKCEVVGSYSTDESKPKEIESPQTQTVTPSESQSKLNILYDSGYPYEYDQHSSGIQNIRVGIKNTSEKEIPRVKVQIDEIRLGGRVYKSLPLCMAREPHYLEFPLAPEETEFVSIAFSIAHNKYAAIDHRSGDQINNDLNPGTYKFTISAIGTDTKPCRKQAVLDVDAEGHLIFRLVGD